MEARLIFRNIRYQKLLLLPFLLIGAVQCLVAQDTKSVTPSQDVAQAFVLADSGSKPSGRGENWSQWHRLSLGQAPKGYTLSNVEFWLTGDHSCGNRAECRKVAENDQQVIPRCCFCGLFYFRNNTRVINMRGCDYVSAHRRSGKIEPFNRAPGQPSPRYVSLKERSEAFRDRFAAGSAGNRLFTRMRDNSVEILNR